MKLPKEYKKFTVPGGYEKCTSRYGRKLLRKFGFGPMAIVEEVSKKKTKKKTK
tara:strand:+ start:148 stop:306 length:159 start_codon:yes stop_codon:yes gene_type:complete